MAKKGCRKERHEKIKELVKRGITPQDLKKMMLPEYPIPKDYVKKKKLNKT